MQCTFFYDQRSDDDNNLNFEIACMFLPSTDRYDENFYQEVIQS